jgi:hypothetical protein
MARRISDVYIVESLLQSTEALPEPLRWTEVGPSGGATDAHVCQVGGVRITLNFVPGTAGCRLWLTLSDENDNVHVREPEPVGLFGRKYKNDDERRLAKAVQHLRSAVLRQCRLRKVQAAEQAESVRERIFRQLLFGGLDAQPGD